MQNNRLVELFTLIHQRDGATWEHVADVMQLDYRTICRHVTEHLYPPNRGSALFWALQYWADFGIDAAAFEQIPTNADMRILRDECALAQKVYLQHLGIDAAMFYQNNPPKPKRVHYFAMLYLARKFPNPTRQFLFMANSHI